MSTTRINYVKNPSFADGTTTYWENNVPGFSPALAVATTQTYQGTYSLRVYKTSLAGCGAKNSGYRMPVTEGLPYTASCYVKLPNELVEGRTIRSAIAWYESENSISPISTSSEDLIVYGFDDFTSVFVTAEAPQGANYAIIAFTQVEAETSGNLATDFYQSFYIDAVLFEQSAYVNGFFETLSQDKETTSVNKAMGPVPYPNITGMELNADVRLNDLVFNTVDEDGVVWICADMQGWWGQPDPEVQDIPRGLGDGSYDVRGRYASRIISFSGVFFPPNKDAVAIARDKLVRAIDLVKVGGWLIADEEPSRASFVRLVSRPEIETVNSRGRTEFSFELRAADPIKYEWVYGNEFGRTVESVPINDNAAITNIGNTSVPCILEIHGPLAVGTVIANSDTQQSITLEQPLRGKETVTNVATYSRSAQVVTLNFATAHPYIIGDYIDVSGSDNTGEIDGTDFYVRDVVINTETNMYTLEYIQVTGTLLDDIASTTPTGTVETNLNTEDVLEIDTFMQEVSFNGSNLGYRFYINTLAEWIYLQPGVNNVNLTDDSYTSGEEGFIDVYYRSGWIG
jgi:phage-related protein